MSAAEPHGDVGAHLSTVCIEPDTHIHVRPPRTLSDGTRGSWLVVIGIGGALTLHVTAAETLTRLRDAIDAALAEHAAAGDQ